MIFFKRQAKTIFFIGCVRAFQWNCMICFHDCWPKQIRRRLGIFSLFFVLAIQLSFAQNKNEAVKINLEVLPGLQFDKVRFQVKPKQRVKLVFTNTDDMDHNLLVVAPGSRDRVVQQAALLGSDGPSKEYNPNTDDVLWSIPILHGGDSKEVEFIAPDKEGVYPYVCTAPGHGMLMYGAMYVSASGEMPDIEHDMHIPESRRQTSTSAVANHPYKLEPPYYYRTYIDGASPAAIIMHLPHQLSYCWDAASCRFVFAWQGDFVDNTAIWKGHKDAKAEILGHVFYREKQSLPIEVIGRNKLDKVAFRGYKLIEGGYLEFHYRLGELDVYETIKESDHGNSLVREFRIPSLKDKIYFNYTPNNHVKYYYKGKELLGNRVELTADEAKRFSVSLKIVK